MSSGEMARDAGNIPHSALYTAATWQWGKIPCAQITTPEQAAGLFRLVNRYMKFYLWLNPKKHSLRHTLLHRHTMINRLLELSDTRQIIEVAAGFSPRGAQYSTSTDITYYEVDLPDVISLKQQQLSASKQGQNILNRKNFIQLPADILQLDFDNRFSEQPSHIITEGLMMYFDRDEQLKIWRNIAGFLKRRGGHFVFDYIPRDCEPQRSPLGKLLHGFKQMLGGDGQGYCYDDRSQYDVKDDLLNSGFTDIQIHNSKYCAKSWQLPYSDIATEVLIFQCS